MKGYLIEKYNNMASAYSCRRLVEEAVKAGIDLRMVGALDSVVTGSGVENNGIVLEECDIVINRYKYGKTKNAINALACRGYNNVSINDIYVNKFEQLQRLSSDSFSVPLYLLSSGSASFDYLVSKLGLPFVAKGLDRSMGQEIFLIKSEADYEAMRSGFATDKEWLFEECITSSLGRDLRLFSIRGKAVACMQRTSRSDFRANVARGADVTSYRIDSALEKIAYDVYRQSKLDFTGIDLLFGNDGYVFCEVNITPGLEGIEQASGVNVAGEIIAVAKADNE